jgi:hypothetical protein
MEKGRPFGIMYFTDDVYTMFRDVDTDILLVVEIVHGFMNDSSELH